MKFIRFFINKDGQYSRPTKADHSQFRSASSLYHRQPAKRRSAIQTTIRTSCRIRTNSPFCQSTQKVTVHRDLELVAAGRRTLAWSEAHQESTAMVEVMQRTLDAAQEAATHLRIARVTTRMCVEDRRGVFKRHRVTSNRFHRRVAA